MRFRLVPTPAQEGALLGHCAHARFVWNLACEQHQDWRAGKASAPGYSEQSRQLTEARKEFGWLAAGRWHLAFAVIPPPVAGPGTGAVVGVDRGVTVSAALSSGELLSVPGLSVGEAERLRRLQRRLARAQRGSNRHDVIRVEDLKIKNMVRSARGTIAAPGKNVRAKAGLNRSIHAAGWGLLVTRLEDKAVGRVERIRPAFTSQTCHACGHRAPENRKSQAVFRCRACGHADHADANAAKNIAAGHVVTARGGRPLGRPVNREPQPVTSSP
jgi:putative transposase